MPDVSGVRKAVAALLALGPLLCGCGTGDRDDTTARAQENRQPTRWQDTQPEDYSFTLDSDCGERSLIGRFAVTVRAGEVTMVEGLDEPSRLMIDQGLSTEIPTISELLDELAQARRDGADRTDVVVDPSDGHPTRIDIDWKLDATDDEACYRISDYTG
ncbi:MAG: DUF6174 domain-containing protein [Actinomycetes bacterium]